MKKSIILTIASVTLILCSHQASAYLEIGSFNRQTDQIWVEDLHKEQHYQNYLDYQKRIMNQEREGFILQTLSEQEQFKKNNKQKTPQQPRRVYLY